MKALHALEEMAGISIVAPLAEHHAAVMKVAKINLNKSQQKKLAACESSCESLEFVIENWKSGNSKCPRTWKSLLRILRRAKLEDLYVQIWNCIGKLTYSSIS